MIFIFFTYGPNPFRLEFDFSSFRNCVGFSEKHSEFILQTCRPHLLFKLASMLLNLISEDGDICILFLIASIVHFLHQNALNDVDLSEIFMKIQSSVRKCVVCDSQTQICLCPFCGACTCSECLKKIGDQLNPIMVCPACRNPKIFKPFAHRKQDNTLLWTAIFFSSIFGRHINDFEEAERLDLESLRESLNAFLQQHNPFRYRQVMCIARLDYGGASAEGASDGASAEGASDNASAEGASGCTSAEGASEGASAEVDSEGASVEVASNRISAIYD